MLLLLLLLMLLWISRNWQRCWVFLASTVRYTNAQSFYPYRSRAR